MNAMGSMMSMGGGRMLDMSQMRKPMFQKADCNGSFTHDEMRASGDRMSSEMRGTLIDL